MPRALRATTFRSVWETIVPSTTGSVSRARPMRRARISAREGSPRRAGSVADISTPMNVPCIASRRFARRHVGAAVRIACQLIARANIAPHISASAAARRPGLEASSEVATRVTPTRWSARTASAAPAIVLSAKPARRSVRSLPAPMLDRLLRARRLQARQALGRDRGQHVARRQPVAASAPHERPARPGPARGGDRLLVAVGGFGRDVGPGEALRTLPRRARHALAPSRIQRERAQLLGECQRVARRREHAVLAVAHDVAVTGDVGRDHGRGGGERLRQDHAEALAALRRRAQHVGLAQARELLLLGDLAERLDPGAVEGHVSDLFGARTDERELRGHVLAKGLEGGDQNRQALALHGLPDEEDAQLLALGAPALRHGLQVHAVGDDPVVAAEEAACGPRGRFGDREPRVQPVHAPPPAERDGGDAVGQGVLGVGVEGPHQRQLAGGAQRVPGDDRDHRLVDVRDVVAALAQLAPQRGSRRAASATRWRRRRWPRCPPCARATRTPRAWDDAAGARPCAGGPRAGRPGRRARSRAARGPARRARPRELRCGG